MTSGVTYGLYVVLALGGAGVFFLMPRTDRPRTLFGVVFGISALALLLVLAATQWIAPGTGGVYFCLFAGVAIAAAARVITHPKPVYSAIYFALVILAVAALLVLQRAEFLAVALIIIYAGAILVTYVFVIMLAQQTGQPTYDRRAREPFLAVFAGFVLTAAVAGRAAELAQSVEQVRVAAVAVAAQESSPAFEGQSDQGNTAQIGQLLMTRYVIALEIAGVLLLIAMIGAIALSKKRVSAERSSQEARPLGQIGREVGPY